MMKPDKKENEAERAMKFGQGAAQTGEAIKKMSDWPKGVKDYFSDKKLENRANTPGAQSPAGASGTPGGTSPAAPVKATGLAPVGDKLATPTSNQLALGPEIREMGLDRTAPQPGLGGQRYADSGQTMNDAGRQPFLPDSTNSVDAAYSGQTYELPPSAAQPPLQGLKEQEVAFENGDGGSDMQSAANDSLDNMGGDGFDGLNFDTSGFDNFADVGSGMDDMSSMADMGDFADFGDVLSFAKRGGRIQTPFAYGGVVPRQHYAGAGPVLPYDTSDNPNEIMDSTLAQQEKESKDDVSEFNSMKPKGGSSGGGGGGGGFNPMSAIGPAISLIGMFSDARLKKNIEPVGKTYDGQNIYRYDFGDGKTQLGLIAQEVAKHKPRAVGKKDGYLTVDYKQATKDASPFAYGGLVPREHHNGNDGDNVVGDNATTVVEQSPRLSREDLSAEAEPTGLDTRLVATASDKADQHFDKALRKTLQIEGGYTNDSGGPTMMGISSKANPDVDLKRVASDPQYKADIYRSRYYDPIVTPDMTPEMKTLAFDTAVNHGVGKAKEMLDEAGGDPAKLLQLRQQHYDSLIAENPNKYGRYEKGWKNRLASLSSEAGGEPAAPKSGLGSFLSGKSGKGMYNGVSSENAGLGDIVREYAPKGLPTSENAILPALGFLGGMLSSPNPKFLGALGSGLVSGVSTQFELDKLNEERVKNAYNLMKDRFVDSMQTDANGNSYLMKMDKDTNKLYTTEQMATIRANILKASGVSARSFEEMGGADQQTTKGNMAVSQSAPTALPKQGEVKVADSAAGAASPGTTPATAADPVAAAAEQRYPKPSEDISKTDMTVSQLEADAFHNPQKYGLREDPKILLGNIQKARKTAEFWQRQGTKDGSENANRLETYIANEDKKLNDMLAKATSFQVEKNKEIVKATVGDAKTYGEKIAERTAIYREKRNQLMALAQLQAEGLQTGYGAEAMRDIESLYSTVTGGKEMPLKTNNKDKFDEAAKIAAAQIVNSIKDAGLQRAPGAGLKTEGRIVPGPGLSSGAIHKLLGSTLGEMDYVHERDAEYVKKHRYEDPTTFLMNYDSKKDEKTGYSGDKRYNKKVADAYSSLPVPTYGDGVSEVVEGIRRKYGEYGYRPLSQKDVAAPAAGSGKSVVRSGTVNSGPNAGKKIIEYSDGTKEYQ
jgi:hypothetical protein